MLYPQIVIWLQIDPFSLWDLVKTGGVPAVFFVLWLLEKKEGKEKDKKYTELQDKYSNVIKQSAEEQSALLEKVLVSNNENLEKNKHIILEHERNVITRLKDETDRIVTSINNAGKRN